MMSEEYMAVKIFNEVWMEVGHREKSKRLAIMHADRMIEMAFFRRGYGIIPIYYTKRYWIDVRKYICNLSNT
jgi:hypothetical protein